VPEEEEDDGIDEDVVVIIDNGSGTCKAGLSCDEAPKAVFAEVVGKPRKVWRSSLEKDIYYGDEVNDVRNKLAVTYPLENGIIENFEHMELLWEHTFFEQLKVQPHKHPVLLTEPPYNPKPNREKMVEIMFETFGVPSLNISIQGVLALLGQGRTTGIVLDSGEGVTHTIPIFDGFGLPHCINRLDLAGRDLNTLLAKLLAQEGTCLTTTTQQHHVRQMKEQHCYVAMDPTAEFAESVDYRIPGEKPVTLTDERWKCPEALFTPSMVGLESVGVAGLVWESITRCDIDLRKMLLSNVVLSGGSTMFPGFGERLAKDLRGFAPTASQAHVRVVQSKDQKLAVWSGAQVFANLRSMQEDQWMTIEDYDEYGVSFIHDKIAVKYS
jgi:actin beta/gamma 1